MIPSVGVRLVSSDGSLGWRPLHEDVRVLLLLQFGRVKLHFEELLDNWIAIKWLFHTMFVE